jgi:cobalamin transport system substrate-binding protein
VNRHRDSSFHNKHPGASHREENREAGENPARSRHCDENRSIAVQRSPGDRRDCRYCRTSKPGDLPRGFAAFERSRKGVQAARGPYSKLKSRRLFLFAKDPEESAGLLFKLHPLELRLRQTALWLSLCCALLPLFSCSAPEPTTSPESISATRTFVDDEGRKIAVPEKINRVVSLAPNLTEIVFALGAGDRLVGNTTYCDYPPDAKVITKVGDTLHPSIERIIALKPQVVLVSTASQLEAFTRQLDDHKIAVYVTNPKTLDEVFRSMKNLGELLGEAKRAETVVGELQSRAATVETATNQVKPVRVFYQVSGEPLYTIGRDAYLTDLVRRAGGVSVTADVPSGFPRYSDEAALAAQPEAIILPTGGSMGSANASVALSLKNSPAARNNRVYKINDDHLSRPGPRLLDGLEEMARALHPEVFK